MLKLTNIKNNASNRNCIATLQATARKQRITHIRLHSISTVFTGRGAGCVADVAAVGGIIALCIVFMMPIQNFTFLRNNLFGYTGNSWCRLYVLLHCACWRFVFQFFLELTPFNILWSFNMDFMEKYSLDICLLKRFNQMYNQKNSLPPREKQLVSSVMSNWNHDISLAWNDIYNLHMNFKLVFTIEHWTLFWIFDWKYIFFFIWNLFLFFQCLFHKLLKAL